MFKKKLLAVGLASLALACGQNEICDDNIINDEKDNLVDCLNVEQCGEDPACEVAASSDTGAVRGVEADIADGTAAFEFRTIQVGNPGSIPIDAAAFVIVVSDLANICELLLSGVEADGTSVVFVGFDTAETDPAVAFPAGSTFTANGTTSFGFVQMVVVQGGVIVASAASEQLGTVNINKVGADSFVSASFTDEVTQDITVEAEFDTDVDGDGINDFLAIAPVAVSADFTNATKCDGLGAAAFGL